MRVGTFIGEDDVVIGGVGDFGGVGGDGREHGGPLVKGKRVKVKG